MSGTEINEKLPFFPLWGGWSKKTKQTLCTQLRLQDFHETYFNDMIEMGFLKESNQLLLIKNSLIK